MSGEAEAAAWLSERAERVIETALARLFVAGDTVFKQKKTVSLGYVDFSTPARRAWALARELELNAPGAPDLYRGVRAVTRRADGGLELDGPGEVVERVLEMRRFADEALLAANPEALDGEMAEALGRTIAAFHAVAPQRRTTGLDFTVPSNAQLMGELADALGRADVEELIGCTNREYARLQPLLETRAQAGFSRRCHGDLHLGNILVEQGRPVLFDCIEFNDALSDIDVLYDFAFLLMDLGFRGGRDTATRALSGYLDAAARDFPADIWDGLAALPLMQSVRATVRAHVAAYSQDLPLARRYVAEALAHLAPKSPRLLAVGGRSGTGKTAVARAMAPHIGPAPGAVILRSDEIRKRLAGVAPAAAAGPSAYTPQMDQAVYEAMFETARRLLRANHAVALDATFLSLELRSRAERVARDVGVPFAGAWLQAPFEVLAPRVAGRQDDASEATVEVLRRQMARDEGPMSWMRYDAARPAEETARHWLALFNG